jgi:hypothetical protein
VEEKFTRPAKNCKFKIFNFKFAIRTARKEKTSQSTAAAGDKRRAIGRQILKL